MKIRFLGTNGWYDDKSHNTISTLIDVKDCYLILDAGYGITKSIKYLKKDKPIYLFLSHLHLDHIVGLHALPLFHDKNVTIYLPVGMKRYYDILVRAPFTGLGDKFKIKELKPGVYKSPVNFECLFLQHTVPTLGFRFNLEGKVITYCCDTTVCKNDLLLAKNADVLIHECSNKVGTSGGWGHSNPVDVGKLAVRAKVKRLFLTHFAPNVYKKFSDRKWAEKQTKKYFLNTKIASENEVISLPSTKNNYL
ncbi:MAG: Beta-lactamase domain protein [Candidatus Magasanikbacteria bacterium GW2011_GWC2_37_14]|uniref:Beta-lactamase domain protein n=1 Tax=Candidatus Magasanikbacteria bacterium GW2011_GWC2_37_14 TaxID=1619046 RepID=A0A0G0IUG1_9BACT|nr:MAG: Beta-lactamase domain protein [Candidatus Magasanikbacteria bacterium GW2011_GWC2_37_14]